MSRGKKNNRFKLKRQVASEPMSSTEFTKIEDMLAKLFAQAYAADNPEAFELDSNEPDAKKIEDSPNLEVIDNEKDNKEA